MYLFESTNYHLGHPVILQVTEISRELGSPGSKKKGCSDGSISERHQVFHWISLWIVLNLVVSLWIVDCGLCYTYYISLAMYR